MQAIFETLLTYDYLARPSKLVPMAAEALPQVTDDGKTYTFKIRKGVHFTPDPAFKGQKRELVADDFAYSLKRLIDPKVRSPYAFLVEGKIVGLDEAAAAAKKSGKFDYDAKIAGLEVVDRYTLRIRLKETDYGLSYVLAHEPTSAVAREVVEAYADESGRIDVESGRHRPVQAREVGALVEDLARGQSRLPRLRLGLQGRRRRRGCAHRQGDEGQEDAAGRPRSRSASSRRTRRGCSRSRAARSTS